MTGRAWAYVGAVLGAVVSVAANVAHSFVPPSGSPAGWTPQAGAVAGSVFWPLALLVSLEILARVEWPDEKRWLAVRWLGLTPVGIVAAVVSYRHLSGLLGYYGEDAVTVLIGPLAVDGLMLIASGALLVEPSVKRAAARKKPAQPAAVDVPAQPAPKPQKAPTAPKKAPAPVPRKPSDVDDLLLVGQAVAGELERAGQPLTRTSLMNGLRERGHSIGTDRARELLATLRAA